jgi:hypothetical protein
MKSTAIKYGYAFAWAGFILFATIVNAQTLETLPLSSLFAYDKPIHVMLFGVQAWLLIQARLSTVYRYSKVVVFWCCVTSALYGLTTELLQGLLTTSRTFDYYDLLADCVGCTIVFIWYWSKRKVFGGLS